MPIRILMRAVWLLLQHAGLAATSEGRHVEAWLALFDPPGPPRGSASKHR